ncbi:MAG: hypothetical protein KAS66_15525, partial [Candidatus Omnitrophica bacterium]|nr:hypothetical protein [Candidatus Omnitrophota bacterium]
MPFTQIEEALDILRKVREEYIAGLKRGRWDVHTQQWLVEALMNHPQTRFKERFTYFSQMAREYNVSRLLADSGPHQKMHPVVKRALSELMNGDQQEAFLDWLRASLVRGVSVSQNLEPLDYCDAESGKDIADVVDAVHARGFDVWLVTHGWKTGDHRAQKAAEHLAALPFDFQINLSFHIWHNDALRAVYGNGNQTKAQVNENEINRIAQKYKDQFINVIRTFRNKELIARYVYDGMGQVTAINNLQQRIWKDIKDETGFPENNIWHWAVEWTKGRADNIRRRFDIETLPRWDKYGGINRVFNNIYLTFSILGDVSFYIENVMFENRSDQELLLGEMLNEGYTLERVDKDDVPEIYHYRIKEPVVKVSSSPARRTERRKCQVPRPDPISQAQDSTACCKEKNVLKPVTFKMTERKTDLIVKTKSSSPVKRNRRKAEDKFIVSKMPLEQLTALFRRQIEIFFPEEMALIVKAETGNDEVLKQKGRAAVYDIYETVAGKYYDYNGNTGKSYNCNLGTLLISPYFGRKPRVAFWKSFPRLNLVIWELGPVQWSSLSPEEFSEAVGYFIFKYNPRIKELVSLLSGISIMMAQNGIARHVFMALLFSHLTLKAELRKLVSGIKRLHLAKGKLSYFVKQGDRWRGRLTTYFDYLDLIEMDFDPLHWRSRDEFISNVHYRVFRDNPEKKALIESLEERMISKRIVTQEEIDRGARALLSIEENDMKRWKIKRALDKNPRRFIDSASLQETINICFPLFNIIERSPRILNHNVESMIDISCKDLLDVFTAQDILNKLSGKFKPSLKRILTCGLFRSKKAFVSGNKVLSSYALVNVYRRDLFRRIPALKYYIENSFKGKRLPYSKAAGLLLEFFYGREKLKESVLEDLFRLYFQFKPRILNEYLIRLNSPYVQKYGFFIYEELFGKDWRQLSYDNSLQTRFYPAGQNKPKLKDNLSEVDGTRGGVVRSSSPVRRDKRPVLRIRDGMDTATTDKSSANSKQITRAGPGRGRQSSPIREPGNTARSLLTLFLSESSTFIFINSIYKHIHEKIRTAIKNDGAHIFFAAKKEFSIGPLGGGDLSYRGRNRTGAYTSPSATPISGSSSPVGVKDHNVTRSQVTSSISLVTDDWCLVTGEAHSGSPVTLGALVAELRPDMVMDGDRLRRLKVFLAQCFLLRKRFTGRSQDYLDECFSARRIADLFYLAEQYQFNVFDLLKDSKEASTRWVEKDKDRKIEYSFMLSPKGILSIAEVDSFSHTRLIASFTLTSYFIHDPADWGFNIGNFLTKALAFVAWTKRKKCITIQIFSDTESGITKLACHYKDIGFKVLPREGFLRLPFVKVFFKYTRIGRMKLFGGLDAGILTRAQAEFIRAFDPSGWKKWSQRRLDRFFRKFAPHLANRVSSSPLSAKPASSPARVEGLLEAAAPFLLSETAASPSTDTRPSSLTSIRIGMDSFSSSPLGPFGDFISYFAEEIRKSDAVEKIKTDIADWVENNPEFIARFILASIQNLFGVNVASGNVKRVEGFEVEDGDVGVRRSIAGVELVDILDREFVFAIKAPKYLGTIEQEFINIRRVKKAVLRFKVNGVIVPAAGTLLMMNVWSDNPRMPHPYLLSEEFIAGRTAARLIGEALERGERFFESVVKFDFPEPGFVILGDGLPITVKNALRWRIHYLLRFYSKGPLTAEEIWRASRLSEFGYSLEDVEAILEELLDHKRTDCRLYREETNKGIVYSPRKGEGSSSPGRKLSSSPCSQGKRRAYGPRLCLERKQLLHLINILGDKLSALIKVAYRDGFISEREIDVLLYAQVHKDVSVEGLDEPLAIRYGVHPNTVGHWLLGRRYRRKKTSRAYRRLFVRAPAAVKGELEEKLKNKISAHLMDFALESSDPGVLRMAQSVLSDWDMSGRYAYKRRRIAQA